MIKSARTRADLCGVHEDMPQWVEEWLGRSGFWSSRPGSSYSWRQLEAGDVPLPEHPSVSGLQPLQRLQLAIILLDPVAFAECLLVEHSDSGRPSPWRLAPVQRQRIRYRGHLIDRSATATGKTREQLAMALQSLCTTNRNSLMCTHEDQLLEEIWREIERQRAASPFLRSFLPDEGMRRSGRRTVVSTTGAVVTLIPVANTGGRALMGIHLRGYFLGDECDFWDDPEVFINVWRAFRPSCRARLYSAPSGLTNTPFYLLGARAVPLAEVPTGFDGQESKSGVCPDFAIVRLSRPALGERLWSQEMDDAAARQFGGRESNGYRRYVLGLDGDPEEGVFPRDQVRAAVSQLDYVAITIAWDEAKSEVAVSVKRPDPRPGGQMLEVVSETHSLDFEPNQVFREHLTRLGAHYVIGVDVGFSPDPTEILIAEVVEAALHVVARVSLKRRLYQGQAADIATLVDIFTPDHGVGLDATGIGRSVEMLLRPMLLCELEGYVWNTKDPVFDEDGCPIVDQAGRPILESKKELATRELEYRFQRRTIRLPPDPDLTRQFENHTARLSPSGSRLFVRHNDHLVEAARALALRVARSNGFEEPVAFQATAPRRRPWQRTEFAPERALSLCGELRV